MVRLQQFSDRGVHISCALPFGKDAMLISWTMTIPFFNSFFVWKWQWGVVFFPTWYLKTSKTSITKDELWLESLLGKPLAVSPNIHPFKFCLAFTRTWTFRKRTVPPFYGRPSGWLEVPKSTLDVGWERDFLLLSIGTWLFDRDPCNGVFEPLHIP